MSDIEPLPVGTRVRFWRPGHDIRGHWYPDNLHTGEIIGIDSAAPEWCRYKIALEGSNGQRILTLFDEDVIEVLTTEEKIARLRQLRDEVS